jgi:hypothetical protein
MKKFNNQRIALRALVVYFVIGLSMSLFQNIHSYFAGGPTAFIWTGSVKGNLILAFWWFIVPSVIWPVNIFWGVYHSIT